MLVAPLRTANTSSDSPEDTPLVTPDSQIFPSLGSAVELATNATTNSYGSLFAPVPKPLPLRPSFGVELTSPTRRRASDGRLREPSASGEERAQALGTVRRMLEELRVSPDGRPVTLSPTRDGTWTPMDRYVPPWKLNQPRGSSAGAGREALHSSANKQVPKVNLNDETLDEDEQLAMLKNLEKEEANTSVWSGIHEAVRVVEKLAGPNWPSWSFWFQRKVCAANGAFWGHIDGSCGPESSENWDADEAAIYCALFSSLDVGIVDEQVRRCTTAKEVWELLELLYKEKPTPETRTVDLIREMARMGYYEDHDLQRYLHRFERIVDELNESAYPVPLELAKHFVLSSLPGSILKHAVSLRAKEHTSINELCQDILELEKQVATEDHPSQRHIGALLPPDLRYYKYMGDGTLADGALYLRAKKTCGACLSYGHKAYTPKCPQTEARLGLWGLQRDEQRPWYQRPECNRKDPRQALGVGNGRVSGPTTPSRSGRTSSAEGMSVRSEYPSPRSRVTSEGAIASSKNGHKLSAFELESWR